jgi:signal transduction histidine kinase
VVAPCDHSLVQSRAVRVLIVVTGIALGLVAYDVQIDNLGPLTTHLRSAASVVAAWSFLVAGIAAWSRRPQNRLGPLMVATCFALLARQLRYSHDAQAFTVFFALGELGYALIAHTALAYPSGRVTDRLERGFLAVAYATVLAFPLAILLVYDGQARLRYFADPRESLISVTSDPGLTSFLEDAYALIGYGFLAAAFIALVARKFIRATPRARRILAPILLAALFAALWAVYNSVVDFSSRPPGFVAHNVFWWQIAALAALPIALFFGLIRSRLARADIGELVLKLEHTPPSGIRDALADALDDPTLEIVFWLPERQEFADVDGRQVAVPEDGPDRAVTMLDQGGELLASLLHDPTLRDEPELIDAAAAAARLALNNARLHAEVQAQLAKVKESRARIVAAGDEQRRRIERDLHDGAQQRLVALALELRSAERRLDGTADPDVERLLAAAAEEVQVAVEELRELAGGIHPGILTQGGLAVALGALAGKATVPVTVEANVDRLPPELEATAYFVASEALTNVAKHARASSASLRAFVENGNLVIEIEDDGVGGAAVDGGTGLRGLADRVEAQGGRLRIESPRGGGTRVIGEIPCGS